MGLYQNILEAADGGAFVNLRDGSGNNISSTSGSLNVNVTNSIAVGIADESTFTQGTTSFLPIGGQYQTSITNLTAGQSGVVNLTAFRDMRMNLRTSGGVELLGQQTMAASIPVVISSNQSTITVTDASLGSASGGTAGTSSALAGAIYNTSAPTLTNGQQVGLQSDVNGNLKVADASNASILALMKPATGTLTQVTVTTSTGSLLASNAARKGFSMQNISNKIMYLAAAATASAAAFTVAVQINGFYEQMDRSVYTGAWSVIGATGITGSSQAIVTEYT